VGQRTSVTTDANGRRVLAKVAATAAEAARLDQEAASLEAGRHPGVVELVGVDGHGVGAALLTAHVDGPALSSVGQLPLEEGAGVLAAVASTLADLHALGLVHGAICADHVILGPGGRPVLCALGYGGRIGEPAGPVPALGADYVDPCRPGAPALDAAFDVFGLGVLARQLAPDPPPGHVLAQVGAAATAPDPAARPSARSIADDVQRAVPSARLPRGLAPRPAPTARPQPRAADPLDAWRHERGSNGGGRSPGRVRPAAVGAAVLVAGALVAAVVLSGRPGRRAPTLAAPTLAAPAVEGASPATATAPPPPADEVRPDPTTTRAGPASSTTLARPTTVPARRDCPPATGLLQADVDGDGCPDSLRYADGILQAGARRWSLGQAGDQVATGDWGCQGTLTLALFRPSTGEVFRFDGWAGPGHDLKATAIAVVAGGQALRAADVDRDGCHEVVVERGAGPAEVIRLPKPQP
jgi:hypothetical protein